MKAQFNLSDRYAAAAALRASMPNRRGIAAGTRVETWDGWKRVETLTEGDMVYVRDGGMRPILSVDRVYFRGRKSLDTLSGSVLVPCGALQNCTPMLLLPDQHVLFETPEAQAVLRTPFTLLPGHALCGHNGITAIRPQGPLEVVTLRFEEEQVIWANTGIMIHCPHDHEAVGPFQSSKYPVYDRQSTKALLGLVDEQDDIRDSQRAA